MRALTSGLWLMVVQSNSYIVPADTRDEHARLMRHVRLAMARLGCRQFEVLEETAADFAASRNSRFVQIMRFRDRQHYQSVQSAERNDPAARELVREFCQLVDYEGQRDRGEVWVKYYVVSQGAGETAMDIGDGEPKI